MTFVLSLTSIRMTRPDESIIDCVFQGKRIIQVLFLIAILEFYIENRTIPTGQRSVYAPACATYEKYRPL